MRSLARESVYQYLFSSLFNPDDEGLFDVLIKGFDDDDKDFATMLKNFVLENDIPTKRPLLEYVDDIDHYVYMCLIHKKCCICGKKSDLHHIDTIGMGNDRTEVQHEGREAMSLCREHHNEMHQIGKQDFFKKYHLNNGVKIDKTLLKIYGLRR